VRQRTARRPAGTAGAGAPTADERTATPSEPGESPSASTLVEVRLQLLEAIYAGQPFRTVLRDLGLSSNRVSGLARTDQEWSERLDAALTASHRGRPGAWHQCRVPARLRVQRLQNSSTGSDGQDRCQRKRRRRLLKEMAKNAFMEAVHVRNVPSECPSGQECCNGSTCYEPRHVLR
jgi:hypothetical protein